MPRKKDGRKLLGCAFNDIMPMKLSESVIEEICGDFETKIGSITAARAIAMAQVSKALRGDSKAYELIRGTLAFGEKDAEDAVPFKVDISLEDEK